MRDCYPESLVSIAVAGLVFAVGVLMINSAGRIWISNPPVGIFFLVDTLISSLAGWWIFGLLIKPKRLCRQLGLKSQQLKLRNEQLLQEKLELKKYHNAVEQSGNAIFMTDIHGQVEYVNPAFCEMSGYRAEEVLGKTPEILKSPETDREEKLRLWRTIASGNRWRGERYNYRKNGEGYWSRISIAPVTDLSGKITHYVGVSEDITDCKETQRYIEKLAFEDPLTGLANRRYFMQQLEVTLQDLTRHGRTAALLFLDLDKFKAVNDTLGHESGDLLLQAVAARLRCCIRQTDMAARLGGDEFILLLREISEPGDVLQVADKLVDTFANPVTLNRHSIRISTSIGIRLIESQHPSASQLLRQADIALYRAKEAGRGGYRLYQPEGKPCATVASLPQTLRHHP